MTTAPLWYTDWWGFGRLRGKFSKPRDAVTQILVCHVYKALYIFMLTCHSEMLFLIGRQDSGQLKLPCYDFHMPNLFSNYSSDILKINLALRKFVLWRFQRTRKCRWSVGEDCKPSGMASPRLWCWKDVPWGVHQVATMLSLSGVLAHSKEVSLIPNL